MNNLPYINFREISLTIKKKFNPEKIILFGSHAYGNPVSGSDVDILIIMNTTLSPLKQAVRIRKELSREIPFDIIVKTPQQIMERIEMSDYFIQDILKKGVVL